MNEPPTGPITEAELTDQIIDGLSRLGLGIVTDAEGNRAIDVLDTDNG